MAESDTVHKGEWAPSTIARIDFAKTCHANLQSMVTLADAKATGLIGVHTLLGAILGSNLIDVIHKAASSGGSRCLSISALITLTTSVGSVLLALAVLVPRTRIRDHVHPPRQAGLLVWIDDLDRFEGRPDDYSEEIAELTPRALLGDLSYENLKISWLLKQKFRWLPRALYLTGVSVCCWAVTLVVAAITT